MNIKTLCLALFVMLSPLAYAEPFALEVQTIRLKQDGAFAVLDAKFINTSPNDLKNWSVGFELVDNNNDGIAIARGMVRSIAAGSSKVTDVLFPDVDAGRVAGVKVTLNGVVDYSGRRVDTQYRLLLTN